LFLLCVDIFYLILYPFILNLRATDNKMPLAPVEIKQ